MVTNFLSDNFIFYRPEQNDVIKSINVNIFKSIYAITMKLCQK